MAAALKITKSDSVLFEPLPNDRLSNAVFLRDLSHAHGLIELTKLVCGWIEISPTPALTTSNPKFYKALPNSLCADPVH